MIIVKFTRSPTLAFPITSDVLTTVKLTLGFTVTLVSLDGTSVVFSLQLAVATLVNVPLVNNLTCTHTLVFVPLVI